jgi:pyruvate,orthophosphate dikinase
MDGLPVTIRLLDPPLHEFLPNWKEYKEWWPRRAARALARPGRATALGRSRPSSAARGEPDARAPGLPPRHHAPEIYGMQVRAIMEAACTAAEQGVRVEPEIMIPLTGTVGEMKETFEQTRRVADGVIAEMGVPGDTSSAP